MDRNKKRALIGIVCVIVWRVYAGVKLRNRIDYIEAKVDLVDQIQDKMLDTMDKAYQEIVDIQFEEIVERYND